MYFINYFLASLFSFFGLILGIILILIAPEEQKPGKKYFILLQDLFFILAIVFFLVFLRINVIFIFSLYIKYEILYMLEKILIFSLIILLIIATIKLKIEDNFKKAGLMYLMLAFIFFLSLKNINLFLIESALIFLFGMPTGSLLFDRIKKNYFKVIFRNIIFLVVALFLFFLTYFI